MTSVILDSKKSTSASLDYSEKKVEEGNAVVMYVRNLPDSLQETLYSTFGEYESNPAISRRMRRFCFHMAVNPSDSDMASGDVRPYADRVTGYVDDVMAGLGFAEQPYVVYRHNDIDREHFHVVSTRVTRSGRPLMRDGRYAVCFDALQLLALMKEIAPKWGFTVGLDEERAMLKDVEAGKLLPTDADKLAKMRANVGEALNYGFTSFSQFRAVLSSLGVHARPRNGSDGERRLWLSADNGRGASSSAGVDADVLMGTGADGETVCRTIARRQEENASNDVDWYSVAGMRAALETAMARAQSLSELDRACSECGLAFLPKMKGGHMETYTMVDPSRRCVASSQTLGRAVSPRELDSRGWSQGEEVRTPVLSASDLAAIRARTEELMAQIATAEKERKRKDAGMGKGMR